LLLLRGEIRSVADLIQAVRADQQTGINRRAAVGTGVARRGAGRSGFRLFILEGLPTFRADHVVDP